MDDTITIENYEDRRQLLVESNANLLGVVLNEKEQQLDRVLSVLKNEYRDSAGNAHYNSPILANPSASESRLFRFCSMMPKGADLHVHDMAELPFDELVQLLCQWDTMYIDTACQRYDLIRVDPGELPPTGYLCFREALESGLVTRETLLHNWTILGADAHSMGIWEWFEELFEKHAVLSDYNEFAAAYYDRAFRYYCAHGISHVEIHLMLTDDLDDAAEYIRLLRQTYYDVKRDYPWFSAKIIGSGQKHDSDKLETSKKCFLNTLYAFENIKDESCPAHVSNFVIGFDLVNEEDTNLPLRAFAPMLLKVHKQYPDLQFYIHSGESLDARNDNLIDAYLLGVSRVGHGLNLYRYPDLMERYIKSEICLEVCPISNQTLGYTPDLRTHPAAEYLRRGVSVALCSDDPVYQEYETLTDDFFAAALCWDLSLADLKQLGINSVMYSGLDNYEKRRLLHAYRQQWDAFIDSALAVF